MQFVAFEARIIFPRYGVSDDEVIMAYFTNRVCPRGGWVDRHGGRCDWDQKRLIAKAIGAQINPDGSLGYIRALDYYTAIPGTNEQMSLDVWSNIHYGFVGSCAGIPARILLKAQNIKFAGVGRDPGDDVSVKIGLDLARNYCPGSRKLTVSALDFAIRHRLGQLRTTGKVVPRPDPRFIHPN